jgi:hypothetical protein
MPILGDPAPAPGDSASGEKDYVEREVYDRPVLPLDPAGGISIKRDVRCIDVEAPAPELARAFHHVLAHPESRFGLIEVLRTREQTGRPFEHGERFQGRFDLEEALLDEIRQSFLRGLGRTFARIADVLEIDELLEQVADRVASDYGVITTLELEPPPGETIRLVYEYLEGTPIAGSSTFLVEPLGERTCRCTQVLHYQEQDAVIVQFMGTGGLKMHNDVVYSEVRQAAELLGARVLRSDI